MKTADQMALEILMSQGSAAKKQAQLTRLYAEVTRTWTGGECPECSHPGPHEDNGCAHETTFLCTKCGCQWEV